MKTVASTGVQTIAVYDSTVGPESPGYLGSVGATALTTCDWDDDGYDDLFLSITTASSVLGIAYDVKGGPTFDLLNLDAIEYPVGPPSRDPSGQDAGLSACDVDHDGDLDLVVGLQGSYTGGTWWFDDPRLTQVEVVRNSTNPEWDYYPALNRDPALSPWEAWSIDADLSDPTTLEVKLGRPMTVLSQRGTEAEIDVRIWRTPHLQGMTEVAPVYSGTSPMPAAGVPLVLTDIYVGETDCSIFEALYTVEARQVLRISGTVVARGPALTALVFSDVNGPQAASLHTIVCVSRGNLSCATQSPPEPEGLPFMGLSGGTLGGPGPPPVPPGQGP